MMRLANRFQNLCEKSFNKKLNEKTMKFNYTNNDKDSQIKKLSLKNQELLIKNEMYKTENDMHYTEISKIHEQSKLWKDKYLKINEEKANYF